MRKRIYASLDEAPRAALEKFAESKRWSLAVAAETLIGEALALHNPYPDHRQSELAAKIGGEG